MLSRVRSVGLGLCPNKRRRGGSRERSEPAPGATTRCGRGSRRREEPRGEHLANGGRDVEAGANEGEAPGRDGLAGEQPWPERRRRQWAWARPAAPWAQTRAADWSEQHWPKRRRRPRACAETKAAARGSDDGTRADAWSEQPEGRERRPGHRGRGGRGRACGLLGNDAGWGVRGLAMLDEQLAWRTARRAWVSRRSVGEDSERKGPASWRGCRALGLREMGCCRGRGLCDERSPGRGSRRSRQGQ